MNTSDFKSDILLNNNVLDIKSEPKDNSFENTEDENQLPDSDIIKEEIDIEEHDLVCFFEKSPKLAVVLNDFLVDPVTRKGVVLKNLSIPLTNNKFPFSWPDWVLKVVICDDDRGLYECSACFFKCIYLGELRRHISLRHEDKIYKRRYICSICQFNTDRRCNLNKHIERIHLKIKIPVKPRMYKCQKCTYEIGTYICMRNHMIVHHTAPEEIKWFECHHCSKKFNTRIGIITHIKGIHSTKAILKHCSMCTFTTESKQELKLHKTYCHRTKPDDSKTYPCTKCQYKALKAGCLEEHVTRRHPETSKNVLYRCKSCLYQSPSKYDFQAHEKTHEEYDISCPKCDFVTNWNKRLRTHVLKKHGESVMRELNMDYRCSECDFTCLLRNEFYKHNKTHLLKCAACSYTTMNKDKLRDHTLRRHTNHATLKKFKCDKCEYQTVVRADWRRHVNTVHKRVYKCSDCDFQCDSQMTFFEHKSMHKGTKFKKIKCNECKYETFTKDQLYYHKKKIHREAFLYCNDCNFKTVVKSRLVRHISQCHRKCKVSA